MELDEVKNDWKTERKRKEHFKFDSMSFDRQTSQRTHSLAEYTLFFIWNRTERCRKSVCL